MALLFNIFHLCLIVTNIFCLTNVNRGIYPKAFNGGSFGRYSTVSSGQFTPKLAYGVFDLNDQYKNVPKIQKSPGKLIPSFLRKLFTLKTFVDSTKARLAETESTLDRLNTTIAECNDQLRQIGEMLNSLQTEEPDPEPPASCEDVPTNILIEGSCLSIISIPTIQGPLDRPTLRSLCEQNDATFPDITKFDGSNRAVSFVQNFVDLIQATVIDDLEGGICLNWLLRSLAFPFRPEINAEVASALQFLKLNALSTAAICIVRDSSNPSTLTVDEIMNVNSANHILCEVTIAK